MELTLSIPIVTVSCKSYLIRNTWKSSGVDNELCEAKFKVCPGIIGIQDRTTIVTYSLVFPWCFKKCATSTKGRGLWESFKVVWNNFAQSRDTHIVIWGINST